MTDFSVTLSISRWHIIGTRLSQMAADIERSLTAYQSGINRQLSVSQLRGMPHIDTIYKSNEDQINKVLLILSTVGIIRVSVAEKSNNIASVLAGNAALSKAINFIQRTTGTVDPVQPKIETLLEQINNPNNSIEPTVVYNLSLLNPEMVESSIKYMEELKRQSFAFQEQIAEMNAQRVTIDFGSIDHMNLVKEALGRS